ncbi:MAG: histidyl-tRNA synthetase [Parcubacteria group bacterium Gr01-1014_56]|nr:MAG: histidyl-tRNA synthetase [Parcubacteria group bacterium Gr01-1014_56]
MGKKDLLSTEPYKGVRDFYPEDQAFLNYLIATFRGALERWGYVEYNASILEPSEIYKAKGSENEEVVREQTYTFVDRGEREVTLRPEMTPTVARMVAGRRRELGFPLRWYSIPNCFRYERPQRGRLREFWQLNVDIFGSSSLAADAEIIAVSHAIMMALGAKQSDFIIKLGSRMYLDTLMQNLNFDEVQGKKLLILLDRSSKMPAGDFERELGEMGVSLEMLSPKTPPQDVLDVMERLKMMGIENAVFDLGVVRGFDYYTGVVFEIFDTDPKNSRSIFGGGRYDNLLALFDDEKVPAVGAAAGDETLRNFLETRNLMPTYLPPTKVYVALTSESLVKEANKVAETLRQGGVAVSVDFGEKKLSDQIKTATKHKIPYLLVVGENELSSGTFVVRDLVSGEEKSLSRDGLLSFFLNL